LAHFLLDAFVHFLITNLQNIFLDYDGQKKWTAKKKVHASNKRNVCTANKTKFCTANKVNVCTSSETLACCKENK